MMVSSLRRLPLGLLVAICLAAWMPAAARAQQTGSVGATGQTSLLVRDWTRAEAWRFFEPRPSGGDPDYEDIANRLQFGVRRDGRRYEFLGALQYVQFGGLPTGAVGPGGLGVGAAYFRHSGRRNSHQIYLRYFHLRLKDLAPGLGVQVGRMGFSGGGEITSADPKIETVKRQRVTARPGGLVPGTETQLFAYRYIDRRAVNARPDNSGRPADRVDVRITSVGGTLVGAYRSPTSEVDIMLWLVGQAGAWYEASHRADAVAAELGHQWTRAPWQPWVRGGVQHASGDGNPEDQRHETFFQMLPTGRKFSRTATYSLMNLSDVFAQVLLAPRAGLSVRVDLHRIALANAADRWYAGSGATQESGSIFGFSTRPSNGATRLGTTIEGSASYAVTPRWSIHGSSGS